MEKTESSWTFNLLGIPGAIMIIWASFEIFNYLGIMKLWLLVIVLVVGIHFLYRGAWIKKNKTE